MILTFYGVAFPFEVVSNDDSYFICRIKFDEEKSDFYDRIVEEDIVWYLDDTGHRLEADKLFEASPWRLILEDNSEVQLLCRWSDKGDDKEGEFKFERKDNYFDWYTVLVSK